jgi:hypothetical protein
MSIEVIEGKEKIRWHFVGVSASFIKGSENKGEIEISQLSDLSSMPSIVNQYYKDTIYKYIPGAGWILFNHTWYQCEDGGPYEEHFGPYFISKTSPLAFLMTKLKNGGVTVLYKRKTSNMVWRLKTKQ